MEIKAIRAIEGKNMYCNRPVIVLQLDLQEYGQCYTNEIEEFTKHLLKHLPGLEEHFCSRGKRGGFVERLTEGTLLGHVVEHIALELQYLVGSDVVYGKTRWLADPSLYEIVFEYEVQECGYLAARQAVQLVEAILQEQPWSLEDNLWQLQKLMAAYALGPSTKAIIAACRKRNIPVLRLGSGSLLQLGYGHKQQRVQATITARTSCIAADIAGDKTLTKLLLNDLGIPTPKGRIALSLEEALLEARKIGSPVVIKPYNGNQGKGVALNLRTPQEITAAFQVAKNYSDKVLVEEYVRGKHYRVLVVNQQIVAVAERIPTFVTGDGIHTIKQLINITNQDPLRGYEHEKPLTKITIDPELILVLTKNGLTLDYIPPAGEKVCLRENANLSTGGIAVDVTAQIHAGNTSLILRAVQAIGLDVAGVDLVTADIGKPVEEEGGAIIEINAAPGIRMHHYPSKGEPRDVGGAIVDYLFPAPENGRIPLAVVTGTNGKTTTTRLLAHMLRNEGHLVGYTTTSGVYIGEEVILKGDTTGPLSAQAVLRDTRVTAAVLETARGGIIRGGLGYDFADVAVVTNITEDHLGQDGIETLEELADIKGLVLDALAKKGTAVLNADDPLVVSLAHRARGQVIYFSQKAENIIVRRHLGIGGTAVFVSGGQVVAATGPVVRKLVPVKDIALTRGGQVIYNLENALAATAAALALGVSQPDISNALMHFGSKRHDNPGRLEIYEVKGVTVVIDYGHNPAGYEQVLRWAKKLNKVAIRGVIGVPGDRPDATIIKAGAVAGRYCQWIYIKEDCDLRGRQQGEVAQLLRQGVLSEDKAKIKGLRIEYEEIKAFKEALEDSRPGEMVIIFYEQLEPVLNCLQAWAGAKVEVPALAMAAE